MARHGPILKDNEATGLRKVFKYLPGLRDAKKKTKIAAKVKKTLHRSATKPILLRPLRTES